MTSDEIRARDPDWNLWRDGCPGGETPAQVLQRAAEFVSLVSRAGDECVLAFGHGHMLRAVAVAFLSLRVEDAGRLSLDTASISILRAGNRGHVLHLWNST